MTGRYHCCGRPCVASAARTRNCPPVAVLRRAPAVRNAVLGWRVQYSMGQSALLASWISRPAGSPGWRRGVQWSRSGENGAGQQPHLGLDYGNAPPACFYRVGLDILPVALIPTTEAAAAAFRPLAFSIGTCLGRRVFDGGTLDYARTGLETYLFSCTGWSNDSSSLQATFNIPSRRYRHDSAPVGRGGCCS